VPDLKAPGAHAEHATPACEASKPGRHTQLCIPSRAVVSSSVFAGHVWHTLASTAPTTAEYVPTPHLVYATSPTSGLNFPAGHALHPPSTGSKPATQLHACTLEEASDDVLSAWQDTHRPLLS